MVSASEDAVSSPEQPMSARRRRMPWGILVLAGFCFAGVATCVAPFVSSGVKSIHEHTWLELDLEPVVSEATATGALSTWLAGSQPSVHDLVKAIDRAGRDERVQGLVARIGAGGHGMALTQELRDAVSRFRKTGKPAIAWSETFGEGGPGQGGYYLATAFDEIWLQPTGDVGLVGVMAETPFFRDLLDAIGVVPRFSGRKEYKTFINQYTERELTAPHRESLSRLLESQNESLVQGIVEGRGLSPEVAEAVVREGPYAANEALERKLVDHLGYRDEVLASLSARSPRKVERLFPLPYLERSGDLEPTGKQIAWIQAVGTISRGVSSRTPGIGGDGLGADTLASAIRAAVADDDIAGIVLRIDSPGGSYIASDTIRREVIRAREQGKPVVASMGNYAASGGYFIAMDADRIVAQPGTLTGSIGVGGGKLSLVKTWEKIGVTWGRVETAPGAGMYSLSRDVTEAEWARFEKSLDRIYADFVGKAAAARKMTPDELDDVARGRVWTGKDAAENGLVDVLGGVDVALHEMKALTSTPTDQSLTLVSFPRELDPLEALLSSLNEGHRENSDAPLMVEHSARLAPEWSTWLRIVATVFADAGDGPLILSPELWLTTRW